MLLCDNTPELALVSALALKLRPGTETCLLITPGGFLLDILVLEGWHCRYVTHSGAWWIAMRPCPTSIAANAAPHLFQGAAQAQVVSAAAVTYGWGHLSAAGERWQNICEGSAVQETGCVPCGSGAANPDGSFVDGTSSAAGSAGFKCFSSCQGKPFICCCTFYAACTSCAVAKGS